MKHGWSDKERQISIQGIHLSVFLNYFLKREGSFKGLFVFVSNNSLITITTFTKLSLVTLLLYFYYL